MLYPTWYYSFPTVLSGEKRKFMIKFSMFFHQPFEVNICTKKMTFHTKSCTRQQGLKFNGTKIYHHRQNNSSNNKTNKQIQKSIIWDTKCPPKCQKKITWGKSSTPQKNSSQDRFKNQGAKKVSFTTESLCKTLKEGLNRKQHISIPYQL